MFEYIQSAARSGLDLHRFISWLAKSCICCNHKNDIFIKAELKKSDDRTNIDKYRVAVILQNIILYQN